MPKSIPKILAFATQGSGGNDEARLRVLLSAFAVDFFPFNHSDKRGSFRHLRQKIRSADLVVMEGTGIAGGLALLFGDKPYVVSSGDAIAPFVAAKQPLLAPAFAAYERRLYSCSSGFIGWTPYLCGRALTFGAPRAVTAAGWAPFPHREESRRTPLRQELGIPGGALVVGIVGSLDWNERVSYCYGYEISRALERVRRPDVYGLIVGGGSGMAHLAGPRVILTGAVPRERIPDYLEAMDVASLPQSRDQLGSFRYSTKLPEYIAVGLPVVTGQLPLAYDLDSGWMWRLPGSAPWDDTYVEALAQLLNQLTPEALAERRAAVPLYLKEFDREAQTRRVTAFLKDVIEEL